MIEPNYILFMNIMIMWMFIEAISHIIAGTAKLEKSTKYDGGNVVVGTILLIALIIALII